MNRYSWTGMLAILSPLFIVAAVLWVMSFFVGCNTAQKRTTEDYNLAKAELAQTETAFNRYEAQCKAAVEGLVGEIKACKQANEQVRVRLDDCLNAGEK